MTDQTKNKSDFTQVGNVIDNLLRSYRKGAAIEPARLWDHWDRIVGETVAENAQPAAFKGKLLIVNVSSSVWVHQLQFLKADLIRKVNEDFGKELITDIKFKIGTLK